MRHAPDDTAEMLIVDDDATVTDLLASLFQAAGYRVTTFRDGEAFAASARRSHPACLMMDVFLPGRSGLQILKEIDATSYHAPIIIMTGHATIALAVEAVRSGAFDVVEKPFDPHAIVARIDEAIESWRSDHNGAASPDDALEFPGIERLTQREKQVLAEIASAASNKEAGRRLGLSPRTIEVHRAHIMMKLGAKNTADLVRLVLGKRSVLGHHRQDIRTSS